MKPLWRFIGVLVVLGANPGGAMAKEKPIIALFDIEDQGSGLNQEQLARLTQYLAVHLAEKGYQIIPRDQIRKRILELKKESYKSCYDQACQVELGRELAAQVSVSSKIIRIGDQCNMTATFYDLRRAATSRAASVKGECSEASLGKAIEKIAVELAQSKEEMEALKDELASFEAEARRAESKKTQPFMPDQEEKKPPDAVEDDDRPVYKAWWFWTIIGVAVAGAGGATAYFLTSGNGDPAGESGHIQVDWR